MTMTMTMAMTMTITMAKAMPMTADGGAAFSPPSHRGVEGRHVLHRAGAGDPRPRRSARRPLRKGDLSFPCPARGPLRPHDANALPNAPVPSPPKRGRPRQRKGGRAAANRGGEAAAAAAAGVALIHAQLSCSAFHAIHFEMQMRSAQPSERLSFPSPRAGGLPRRGARGVPWGAF
eukprot:gene12775-biopygen12051